MKLKALAVFVLVLKVSVSLSNDKISESKVSDDIGNLMYSDPIGGRYLTLTILNDANIVRTFHSTLESGGAFEREVPPRFSPDRKFVFLTQVELAALETPSGSMVSDSAYCSLVEMRSGCVIARETGAFFGGAFTLEGQWSNLLYPNLDMAGFTPKAVACTLGKLRSGESPESSYENLVACDPPNFEKLKEYKEILERNIFGLDGKLRQTLKKT